MKCHYFLFYLIFYNVLPASAADVDRLVLAYPEQIERIDGNYLVWKDGTRMLISDGSGPKSEQQLLSSPDIKDMFYYNYSRGQQSLPPSSDPGRIRNAKFFEKMYGNCKTGQVTKNLAQIDWLPKHGGGRIYISKVNGIYLKLAAVSRDLDQLSENYISYLVPSSGTYNCRFIAGTSNTSAHSYGIAIDINSKKSDYWQWTKKGYRNQVPYEIVSLFEKHGFIWGGKWMHFDTMHFEYRPELIE